MEVAIVQSKLDADFSIQLNRWLLKPIGVWPSTSLTSWKERILLNFLTVICGSLMGGIFLSCILNTLIEEKDLEMKIKTAGPLSFWLMALLKYSMLLLRRKDIRDCIEHINFDWDKVRNEEDRQVMLKNAKMGRSIAAFCAICMHTGIFLYVILVPISARLASNGNSTVRILPYPFYNRIADISTSPAYEIVYLIQAVSAFVVNSVTVGACSLATVFVMHASGQLKVLMLWLENFVESNQIVMEAERKMSVVVKHHLRILNFVSKIEMIMHQICFVDIVGCTLNICFIGYYLITEWENNDTKILITYLIILTSFSFNIFMICYIGEILSNQCFQVGEAAYMGEWYRLPSKTALDFIFIIAISSTVVRLTAGKLFKLSLATFGDVIKSSIAYLNILRRITM